MNKMWKVLSKTALAAAMFFSTPAALLAEEGSEGSIYPEELTTYSNNGYTFEKISHAASGTETYDGVVDYFSRLQITENTDGQSDNADSVQSYTYCATSYGDWVYMGTMYGALSAYTQVENAVKNTGASAEIATAVVDAMFNGKLNKGKEADGIPAGSVFFKFNVKTGETKILMSRTLYNQGKCDGVPIFRSATSYNGKLYFVGLVSDGKALAGQSLYGQNIPNDPAYAINYEISMQNGVPCVYEVDPENDDKLVKVLQCVSVDGYRALNNQWVFTSTRAISTFKATKEDGTEEEWLLAGGLADTTQGEEFGVTIVAAKDIEPVENDYYETSLDVLHGSFSTIATQSDLCDYPAIKRQDSEGGGGLYQICQYGENTVYTAIVSGKAADGTKERTYAMVKGVYDPSKGEVNDAAAWTWTPFVGDQEQGAAYTFGIDPSRTAAGACTLQEYGGYLYIGEYNDVNYSLTDILQNGEFRILAKNLSQSINLYRMDQDENIEMIVGDPTEMFPEGGSTGIGSGYESHMNQYTWMTTVVEDTMYLSTMDETSLTHSIAQLVNGEILSMSEEEWKSQLNYLAVLVKLLAPETTEKIENAVEKIKDLIPEKPADEPEVTDEIAEEVIDEAIESASEDAEMFAPAAMTSDETEEDVPAVELTPAQRQDFVEMIKDGSLKDELLDEEDAEILAALNASLRTIAEMLHEKVSAEFIEAYDNALEMIEEYINGNDKIPANIKAMYSLLLNYADSENLGYLGTCLKYMQDSVAGFDLYAINQAEDGSVEVTTVSNNGFNDRYNHGLRVYTTVPGYMVIGTANPFNGAQIWRMEIDNIEEPEVEPEDPEVDPANPEPGEKDPEVTPDDDKKEPEKKPETKPSTGVNTGDTFNGGILGGMLAACAGLIAAAWYALKK